MKLLRAKRTPMVWMRVLMSRLRDRLVIYWVSRRTTLFEVGDVAVPADLLTVKR